MKSANQQPLPDFDTLNAVVNDLFRQEPGTDPELASLGPKNVATPPVKATAPTVAEHLAVPSLITPRLAPTQAQTADLPGVQSTILPVLPHGGGAAAGVPEAAVSAAPANLSAAEAVRPEWSPTDAPTGKYYFIDDASQAAFSSTPAALSGDSLHFVDRSIPGRNAGSGLYVESPREPAVFTSAPSYYFLQPPAEQLEVPAIAPGRGAFDVQTVRRDFPILASRVNGGRQLVWLDNAATTQKPRAVIERLSRFYEQENSNVHRAAHELAARATDAYESARKKVAAFIGAASPEEIVFVRGTTEAINLVAQSWGKLNISEGDEIILSHLEHHANIVPWQMLAAEKGALLRVIPVDNDGQVRLDEYQKLLSPRTRIVAVSQVSNALGTRAGQGFY